MEVKSIFRNVGGYEWPHVEWYDQRYIRQRKPANSSKICLTVEGFTWLLACCGTHGRLNFPGGRGNASRN